MTRIVLTTPPAVEPLTVAEVRARLSIGSDVSDAVVSALLIAARQQFDGWSGMLGRSLITQTWTLYLDAFDDDGIELPLPPLQSATVNYIDGDGVEQTVDTSVYRIIPGAPSLLALAYSESWPSHRAQDDAVRIALVAGYGDAGSDVPEPIRQAICLKVAQLRSLTQQNLFLRSEDIPGVGSQEWTVSQEAGNALDFAIRSLIAPYVIQAV